MLEIGDFSRAVSAIYDASMSVERWPDALAQCAPIFGARAAQIAVSSSPSDISFLRIWGFPDDLLARLAPIYVALTPTDPRAKMTQTPYKAMHCRQLVSDEELWASEMYQHALKPGGIEYAMAVALPIDVDLSAMIGVMRGPDQAPFTGDECTAFGRLGPHVGRAVSMHAAFRRCRREVDTVKALFDSVPLGMMVVEDQEVQMANCAARTMLEEADAVCLQAGRLCGASRRADADLQDAVAQARGGDAPVGVALPIDHAEPVRAVVRRLHPASASMVGAASRDAVALYVTDPRKPHETREEILQRLFGLTSREAAVLRILAEGEDLHAIAARLGITFETVRSHVKHIMDTTGASRQSELVRMVLASPAWIARGAARSCSDQV